MRFRCYNCRDLRPGRIGQFREFEADRAGCPKCGAGEPAVLELTDVHFLVPGPDGPLTGLAGLRWKVGCEPGREALALHLLDTYAATHDPRAVTCPSCRGLPAWRQAAGAFRELRQGLAIIDPGCCG